MERRLRVLDVEIFQQANLDAPDTAEAKLVIKNIPSPISCLFLDAKECGVLLHAVVDANKREEESVFFPPRVCLLQGRGGEPRRRWRSTILSKGAGGAWKN